MQIHEITRPLTEGILDAFSPAARAARTAASLSAKGYGPGGADPDNPRQKQTAQALSTDWKVKLQNIQKDPAVTQYLNSLIKGWELKQKQLQADLKEAAQEYTTQAGIVVPGGTKTDKSTAPPQAAAPQAAAPQPATDPSASTFVAWSDGQLASRDSYYNNITMQDVRDKVAGIAGVLDQKLDAVVAQKYAPAAIKDYLQTAIAGVQARSQELKNKEPSANLASMSRAQAKLGDIRNTLAGAGINPKALSTIGQNATLKNVRTTGNDVADALLNQAGFKL